MGQNFFLLPVELGTCVIKDRQVSPFAVYLALKSLCSGQVILRTPVISRVKMLCGYKSKKSVYNNLDTLHQLNWIGQDEKWTFIRGFSRLKKYYGITSRSATEIRLDRDLPTLKSFLVAAFIGHLIAWRKSVGRKRARPKPPLNEKYEEKFRVEQISLKILAKFFDCSISTASRYKQEAARHGYLKYSHNFYPTQYKHGQYPLLKKADVHYLHKLRKNHRTNRYDIQLTDEFKVHMKYKSKRN